ncbi:hypothetical protein LDENG_00205830 [Lucifuga dentata]|nr:hypothetical protein LDENG_00205830 [Lucifuga dentata]
MHGLSNPGQRASQKLVLGKFIWCDLKKDVQHWASACVVCQHAKVDQHSKAPLAPFVVPERRFDHFSVDLVDRGVQFTSHLWSSVACELGVMLHWTMAYHPQANGLCKRFHCSLKAALCASLQNDGDGWIDRLPWVMLWLRTAPKADLQESSAELVYGQPLCVPGEFLPDSSTPWCANWQCMIFQDIAELFARAHNASWFALVTRPLGSADGLVYAA